MLMCVVATAELSVIQVHLMQVSVGHISLCDLVYGDHIV